MFGRISSLILALVVLTGHQPLTSQSTGSINGFDLVDKTGNIRKPADVRDRYQALGVYTPVDLDNNTEMHYTYASPGTAEYYRKTGKFADGTALVKEVFATDHAQMTTRDAIPEIRFGAMDGDGPFSNPMRPIGRLQLTTKKTAWVVMFRLSQPTG